MTGCVKASRSSCSAGKIVRIDVREKKKKTREALGVVSVKKKAPATTLLRHLFDRQTGLGPARYEPSQEIMARSVYSLQPTYLMYHRMYYEQTNPKLLAERNCIARMRFNKPGYLVGTSYWAHGSIEFWKWQGDEPQPPQPVQTLMNCSIVRFEWMHSHPQSHIFIVGKYGNVQLIDLDHQMCYNLLDHQCCVSMAYGLHADFPSVIVYGMRNGAVRNFDVRKGPTDSDTFLRAKNKDGSQYEIYSLKVNPVNSHEFAVAGCTEDIRVYDRRKCDEPVHVMCMTTYPGLRTPRPGQREGTGEFSYMTNERRSRRCNLQEMAYNYNGTQLAVSCGYDSVYLFDTSMKYPIGSFGSNCMQSSEDRVTSTITGSVVYGLEYFGHRSDFLVAMARGHEHTYNGEANPQSCKRTSLYVWNSYNQKLVRRIPMSDRNWNFAVHPNQPIITTALDHKGIQFWSSTV